jgi:hypothetical protein
MIHGPMGHEGFIEEEKSMVRQVLVICSDVNSSQSSMGAPKYYIIQGYAVIVIVQYFDKMP